MGVNWDGDRKLAGNWSAGQVWVCRKDKYEHTYTHMLGGIFQGCCQGDSSNGGGRP